MGESQTQHRHVQQINHDHCHANKLARIAWAVLNKPRSFEVTTRGITMAGRKTPT
jgi:hypothetical protein